MDQYPKPKLSIVDDRSGLQYEAINTVALIDMKASKSRILRRNEEENLEEVLDELRKKRVRRKRKKIQFRVARKKLPGLQNYERKLEFTTLASGSVLNRLERLMGSDRVKITDTRYMHTFTERLEGEELEVLKLRDINRRRSERERYRRLVMDGDMDPTSDMDDSILKHPVFRVNRILNKLSKMEDRPNRYGPIQEKPPPVVPIDLTKSMTQLFRENVRRNKLHVIPSLISDFQDEDSDEELSSDSLSSGTDASKTPEEFRGSFQKKRMSSFGLTDGQLRSRAFKREVKTKYRGGPKRGSKKEDSDASDETETDSDDSDKIVCTYKRKKKTAKVDRNKDEKKSLDQPPNKSSRVQFQESKKKREQETPTQRWRRIISKLSSKESEDEESSDDFEETSSKKITSAAAPIKSGTRSDNTSNTRGGKQSRAMEISQEAAKEFAKIQRSIKLEEKRSRFEAESNVPRAGREKQTEIDDEEMKRRESKKQSVHFDKESEIENESEIESDTEKEKEKDKDKETEKEKDKDSDKVKNLDTVKDNKDKEKGKGKGKSKEKDKDKEKAKKFKNSQPKSQSRKKSSRKLN